MVVVAKRKPTQGVRKPSRESNKASRQLTESRELVNSVLSSQTSGERTLSVVHLRGDGGEPLSDSLVRGGLKVTSGLDGDGVLGEGLSDRGRVLQSLGESGDLDGLLSGEREPVLDFRGELLLGGEGDGSVEEGGRGRDHDSVRAEGGNDGLGSLDGGGEVVLPDVPSGNQSEGEDEGGGLDGSDDRLELLSGTVEIDVKGVNGELGDEVDVGTNSAKVGGEGDLESRGGLGEGSVGGGKLRTKSGRHVESESGLVNLDLGRTSSLELDEEFGENGNELVESLDGAESSRVGLVTSGLSEEKVGDGSNEHGAGSDSGGLCLEEFVNGLGVDELEVGQGRDLSLDVVVVGVEPLLHLLSTEIDSIPLASTSHGEVLKKSRTDQFPSPTKNHPRQDSLR